MTDKLELRYCCEVTADTGVSFTLYADSTYDNFYVDWGKLTESASKANYKLSSLGLDLCDAVTNKTRRDIRAVNLESIKPRVTAEFFPTELFGIAAQPYPKPLDVIDVPFLIFSTDGKKPIEIYRHGSHNLICLGLVSNLIHLTSPPQPPLIEKALTSDIYFDGDYYYIDLREVWSLLCRLGDAAKNVRELFNTEIFLELPQGGCEGFIDTREHAKVQSPLGEFIIYAGKGFAENRFFATAWNLEDLLDEDDEHQGALDTVADLVGYVASGRVYYRLDDVGKFVKLYAAQIWNGHNEQNQNLKRAWKFIEWYREFYPAFIKANTPYRAYTHYGEHICEEKSEKVADNISVKEFFATFDRAVENFKKQFEELDNENI